MVVETAEPKDGSTNRTLYMKGIFLQGGVKNLNERVYPVREISGAVEHINEVIRKGESVLGECDHPEELTINIDRVSHMIESMWMDGNYGMGKLRILPTPMGNIIRTLIESGVKLGVSSRGSGNVGNNGEVSDFEMITCDIVARPSAQNAFPKPVYEARNAPRGLGRTISDLSEAVSHDPKAQKHLHRAVLTWIERLK